MIADADLCPPAPGVALIRLGELAKPAGGRQPIPRLTFAACTLDRLEETRAETARRLEARTGPLRCTGVTHQVAEGDRAAAELLEHLVHHEGQSVDVARSGAHVYGQVAAAASRLGLGPAFLVVASCGALTGQASVAVAYS